MVVPKSQDKMFYPPDDMKGDAHVPDFNSYLAMHRKSLENPEGRSSLRSVLVQCLQLLLCIAPPSERVMQYLCVYLFSLQPVTLTWSITSSFFFQLSGKRSPMNSFGRSPQQGQWCSTTLMWQKGTYMSNAWKGPKLTCAIMLWTGLLRRRILVIKLPITGKQ